MPQARGGGRKGDGNGRSPAGARGAKATTPAKAGGAGLPYRTASTSDKDTTLEGAAAAPSEGLLGRLGSAYPDWGCTLDFTTPFELLVATVLAAQCTDETVNRVTAALFAKYRGPAGYLSVEAEELERDIHATGFFRQKARAVRALCRTLIDDMGGVVPADVEALTRLPGVGRKTASIVAGAAFGVPAIGVDTHVDRVARRLGLTAAKDGDRETIEEDLKRLFSRADWIRANWLLILHGRRTCTARKPACPRCPVLDLCPYPEKTVGDADGDAAAAGRKAAGKAASSPARRPRKRKAQ